MFASSASLNQPFIVEEKKTTTQTLADPIRREQEIKKAIFDKFGEMPMKQINGDQKDIAIRSTHARLKMTLSASAILFFGPMQSSIVYEDKDIPPILGSKRLSRPECDILSEIFTKRNNNCSNKFTIVIMIVGIIVGSILSSKATKFEDKLMFAYIAFAAIGLRTLYLTGNACRTITIDEDLSAEMIREFRDKRTEYSLIATRIFNTSEEFRDIITQCAPLQLTRGELGDFQSDALELLDKESSIINRVTKVNREKICCTSQSAPHFFSSAGPLAGDLLAADEYIDVAHPQTMGQWTEQELRSLALRPSDGV